MKKTSPILRAKLRPPRVGPDRLERPRLLAQLDRGLLGQCILVCAPAGYGKTTLLAQWIDREELPAGWLSLDDGDDEPALFLAELVEALGTANPGCCRGTRSALARASVPPLSALTRQLSNDLDELDEFILVLDDCQKLKDPSTLEILRHLMFQPPRSMHLVLSCRADPRIPLGALRGRGLLHEVREADLRFSEQEAAQYLEQVLGRPLKPSHVISVLERTEGWITGLHLAALSLRGRPDVEQVIRDFAGSDRYIADYLLEELLARLDPALQEYLEATSILERLCAPLCRAVMGEAPLEVIEGRPTLEWLEDANLFVVSLDEQREWFRYHHLFRDLLRHRLRTSRPPEQVAALHVRAGEWLGARQQVDAAIDHLLKAGRADLAGDLVEENRREALDWERWRALERWVNRLGEYMVDSRPRLVLIHAWLANQRTDWTDMLRHCDRAEELIDLTEEPLPDGAALRGEIAAMRAEASYWRGEGDAALSQARQALALLPADHRMTRDMATVFEGAGLQLRGEIPEAFQVFRRAAFGEYGKGTHPRITIGLVLMAFMVGDLAQAAQVANRLLSQGRELGLGEIESWAHYFKGLAAYLGNDLSVAEEHFQVVDPYSPHWLLVKQARYGLAWLRLAEGRSQEALEVMDQFMVVVSDLNLPLGTEVQLLRARLARLCGRPVAAAVVARSLLPPAGEGPLGLDVCYEFSPLSALALLLLEGDKDDLAACAAGLQRLLTVAEANGNTFRVVQCLILEALLLDQEGRDAEALAVLSRAVTVAQPGHLVRLFPEMGDRIRPLLAAVRLRGRSDAFLDELIASFTLEALPSRATPSPYPLTPGQEYSIDMPLTNRELDVLKLLEERLSNKEIARRLVIAPATVKRHTLSIYGKLGVSGRHEAVAKARHLGILSTSR
jgi:LuxR family transcriptional regulator, maltose regulon positive regulatory protein